MNAAKLLNTRAAMVGVGLLVGAAVIFFAVKKLKGAAGDAADSFNNGTAYDSDASGAVGTAVRTVANAANQVSLGGLEWLGEKAGAGLFWLLNPNFRNYDPNKE